MYVRHSRDGFGIQPATPHDSYSSRSFGDQNGAVREKRHRPRLLEMAHDDFDAQASLFGRLDINCSAWELRCGPHDRRRCVRVVALMRSEGLMTLLSEGA